jgi:Tol biopolymer transport system component
VYTATSRGEPPQLYSLRPDGHPGQSLTKGPGGNYTPAVSADGKMLAFISTRDGNPDVYLMPLEGGEARRLTRTDQREGNPRFLPDGDLIFSVDRGRSKGSRIVRVPKAADEGEMVLETEQPITGLAVSRDGRRVAYVVGRATDASRGRARFDLFVQPLTAGSTPAPVALRPGEQVLSPSF